ncbi:MAG: ABC transporter substrate-binding protein [Acidobacteria bacterium]|nr:ABC transporter substrate-binding protein [Acidobacteriota bacterium]
MDRERSSTPHARVRRIAVAILATLGTVAAVLQVLACGRPRQPAAAEQVLRFRLREDPPTLDPALANDQISEAVVLNVFRGLVEMDPGTLEVRPAVAAFWTIAEDRRTYTFRLRDDALFHNGRRVTARDVEYSFRRTLSKETNSPRRFILEPIEGAREFAEGKSAAIAGLTIPDEQTIVLRLSRPFAPFLSQLTMVNAALVPREIYDDPARAYLRAPVGCGPFRFSRWEQSNFIELLAFDGYYGGRPALDRIQVRIIENRESALQEYLAGGLDSLDEVPNHDDALMARLGSEVHEYPFIGTQYIGFNHMLPPFKGNTALRKAFNYAVDKEYIWKALGGYPPANGIIPPGIPGHDPDLPGYPYDPAKARRLLAEAGYPDGKGLPPIAFWFNTSEGIRRLAQKIQADLKAIGADVTLREVDWAAYLAAVEGTPEQPGQAQMFRFGWYLDYPDADAILRPLLHSSNWGPAGNYFRYRNPRLDALLDEALSLPDPGARAARYREAERIAVMEDAAWLFLSYYQSQTLFKPYVKGIVHSPLGEFRIPLERLRVEKGAA